MPPICDHPKRYELVNELHARPFPTVSAPSTAVFIAFKKPDMAVSRDRSQDLAHLVDLLDRYGTPHPQPGATHFSGQIGRHVLKWEQHTEFVSYTVFRPGLSARVFDPADFEVFPEDWLNKAPGKRISSATLRCDARPDDASVRAMLEDWFVPESLAVAQVLDSDALVASDFRIDPAGHMRFAVFADAQTDERRIGRIIQRLCEIEVYKTMSMLGFRRSRELSDEIDEMDRRLTMLVSELNTGEAPAEDILTRLLAASAELENAASRNAFRFGATGAYEAIVNQRIAAIRETPFEGQQSFSEFMMRRYEPAMRTVKSTEHRLTTLVDRAARASDLLRTQVDVERSAQNQALLESMDRRADLALRLQHTVEGLSVVAISYYAVSLAAYLLYPAASATGLSKGTLTAAITLPVVGLVWWLVRRIRRKIE